MCTGNSAISLYTTMAAKGFCYSDFPVLKIDSNNSAVSWHWWLTNFNLAIEMVTLKLGTKQVEGAPVQVFTERMKLLALFYAIGDNGKEAITSQGFDLENANETFNHAMQLVKNAYATKETLYVKIMRFITVHQAVDERENDYLLRVERLSRRVNFGDNNDNVRKEFALGVAVNGLRESSLRTRLMQEPDMTWDKLGDVLRTRQLARESEAILTSAKAQVKQEPTAVLSDSSDVSVNKIDKDRRKSHKSRGRSRSSSADKNPNWRAKSDKNDRKSGSGKQSSSSKSGSSSGSSSKKGDKCFNCGEKGHRIRNCPLVRCFICNEYAHTSIDCDKKSRRRSTSRSSVSSREGSSREGSPSRVRFADEKSKSSKT